MREIWLVILLISSQVLLGQSPCASLWNGAVDFGTVDRPTIARYEAVGHYKDRSGVKRDYLGIAYSYANRVDTIYYKFFVGDIEDFDPCSEYRIVPYPGDKTVQIEQKANVFKLCQVGEIKDMKRKFRGVEYSRLCAMATKDGASESRAEVEIGVLNRSDDTLEVNVIDEHGLRMLVYRLPKGTDELLEMAYFDVTSSSICFVDDRCISPLNSRER